jgi:hypothetical protein
VRKQKHLKSLILAILIILGIAGTSSGQNSILQNTHIRGFMEVDAAYHDNKVTFGFGEQDLFITSQLTDRFSFLGEAVFKYAPASPTEFGVSIERAIVKYNYYGNNNLLLGKQHTPINFWNDTYHHGRVFFPTIERPLLFPANFIPLHTTGVAAEGHDLGNIRFGYNLLIGNGLGSTDVANNDERVSVTAAVHIKPVDNLKLGVSYYNDRISAGAEVNGRIIPVPVNQQLFTGSISYFGKKFELLTEGTLALDKTDSTGTQHDWASYLYAGYRVTDKFVPYIRLDNLQYGSGEVYYIKNNTRSFIVGMRYYVDYLLVLKLEYQNLHTEIQGQTYAVTFQIAVGF